MTHKRGENISLAANAYHRTIETRTLNGDINDDSLGESLYQPNAEEREALEEAGYTDFPTSGETQANTPYPSWRCIANILLNDEPNEKCNGLLNRTHTDQQDAGFALQATITTPIAGFDNQLTLGISGLKSRAEFSQPSQFGYLLSDRSIGTVDGPGAFADGSQESEDAFDARVDLEGDTVTRSVYLTDTLEVTPITHLTLSGRYDHTTVDNEDKIIPAGEPGTLTAKHRFHRFNPAIGETITPSKSLSGLSATTKAAARPRQSSSAAPTRRIPAGCPTPWPAIPRSNRS